MFNVSFLAAENEITMKFSLIVMLIIIICLVFLYFAREKKRKEQANRFKNEAYKCAEQYSNAVDEYNKLVAEERRIFNEILIPMSEKDVLSDPEKKTVMQTVCQFEKLAGRVDEQVKVISQFRSDINQAVSTEQERQHLNTVNAMSSFGGLSSAEINKRFGEFEDFRNTIDSEANSSHISSRINQQVVSLVFAKISVLLS